MKIVNNGFWAFGDFDKLRFGFDGGIGFTFDVEPRRFLNAKITG